MRCQKCGAYIRDDSVFCNYCGERVVVSVPQKESEEPPKEAVRPRDEDFDVAPTTPKEQEEKTVSGRQKPWVIALIMLAGVIFAVCAVSFYQVQKKHQKTVINPQTSTPETTQAALTESESPEELTESADLTEESGSESETPEESSGNGQEETSETPDSDEETSEDDSQADDSADESTDGVSEDTSAAEDGVDVEYGGMIFHIADGEATLTKCYAEDAIVELPDQINGVPFTAVGEAAFANCSSLTAIDLPEGVKSLGPYAFTYCRNLRYIVFPDSCTELGDHCFDNSGPVTFIVHEDSFGYQTAVNNNIQYIIGDSVPFGE